VLLTLPEILELSGLVYEASPSSLHIIWAMNVWLMCIVGISIAATIAGRGVPLAISAGLAPQVMTL
jgi:hypothetical protein